MSLRNRNETRLLVENWRKVLEEGLHENDIEILEESLKQKILMGLLMASNLVSGITHASPTGGGDGTKAAMELMQTASQKRAKVSDGSISPEHTLNIKRATKAVEKCYDTGRKLFIKKIKSDKVISDWFKNVSLVHRSSEAELINKFSSEVPRSICNNFLNKTIKLFPEFKSAIPSQSEKDRIAMILLIHVFKNNNPTPEEFKEMINHVTGEITSSEIVADSIDMGGEAGAEILFKNLVNNKHGEDSFEKEVKSFFESELGGEDELLEKLDSSLLDKFVGIFQ